MVDNSSPTGRGSGSPPGPHRRGRRCGSRTLPTQPGRRRRLPRRAGTGPIDRGADLVWLMDDDGLPDLDCLERLLEETDNLDFWGPLVVDEADPGRLVFPIRLPGSTRVVHAVDDVRRAAKADRIDGIVIPFNGVLVTKELVDRIGLPREEFFIWGDDHEYRLRAEEAGARVATVVTATVRHPSVGNLGTPMMFGRTTYNDSPSDLKHYCMARNNLVNLRDYRGAAARDRLRGEDRVVLHLHPPEPVAAAAEPRAMRAGIARRLRRAPEVPRMTGQTGPSGRESVAVVVVTHNRAELLGRLLDGLAGQTRRPRRRDRGRQRQHRRHRRRSWHARTDLPLARHRAGHPRRGGRLPRRCAGGVRRRVGPGVAGGRRRGARDRLPGGAAGRRRGLPDRRPRGPSGRSSRRPRSTSTSATRSRSTRSARRWTRRTPPARRCPTWWRCRTPRSRAS